MVSSFFSLFFFWGGGRGSSHFRFFFCFGIEKFGGKMERGGEGGGRVGGMSDRRILFLMSKGQFLDLVKDAKIKPTQLSNNQRLLFFTSAQ